MQELPLNGRSYTGTAKLLPGVTDTANRESPGWNDLVGININGTRQGSINLTLDGVTSLDTGSMVGPYLAPSLDAVAEVKVLLAAGGPIGNPVHRLDGRGLEQSCLSGQHPGSMTVHFVVNAIILVRRPSPARTWRNWQTHQT
ncbi:MAG: hypothetical protein HYR60_15695 [Acidobacteria bacterium]|nr:hypothetical protein [Acidobacteriota bacterium]